MQEAGQIPDYLDVSIARRYILVVDQGKRSRGFHVHLLTLVSHQHIYECTSQPLTTALLWSWVYRYITEVQMALRDPFLGLAASSAC